MSIFRIRVKRKFHYNFLDPFICWGDNEQIRFGPYYTVYINGYVKNDYSDLKNIKFENFYEQNKNL